MSVFVARTCARVRVRAARPAAAVAREQPLRAVRAEAGAHGGRALRDERNARAPARRAGPLRRRVQLGIARRALPLPAARGRRVPHLHAEARARRARLEAAEGVLLLQHSYLLLRAIIVFFRVFMSEYYTSSIDCRSTWRAAGARSRCCFASW